MRLVILTLSWNGREKLERLHKSLMPNLKDIDYQWFIRDHASNDKSVELIKSWENKYITPIAYKNNLESYSEGINFLYAQANIKDKDNTLLLTLNNDVQFIDNNSIKNMINIIKNDDKVGSVGAKLNYPSSNSTADNPQLGNIQHVGVLFHQNYGLPFHYRANQQEEIRDTKDRIFPILTGAVNMLRASTFEQAHTNKNGTKGLNDRFVWGFEDCNLSMNIAIDLKKANVLCGKTQIIHEESATLKKIGIHKMFLNQNAKVFRELWSKYIDISLVNSYSEDPNFNLYQGPLK